MELSLFETRRSPYYILAPDFRHSSAGVRNLHYLCHVLNELGFEAYVSGASVVSDFLRTPILDEATIERHFRSGRMPIAVYPEIVSGNPLHVPVVARWLLNKPGALGGDVVFGRNDLIFHHLPWCLPDGLDGYPLYVPSVDTRIFNNENNPLDSKRSGFCRYANKYLAWGGKIKPEHESFQSLGHEVPLTPEEIATILRRSEALYCYERSAIIQEAVACGCPVLNVPSGYWDIQSDEVLEGGMEIDAGPASLEKAKSEIGDSAQSLRDNQNQAIWQIQEFGRHTQEHAKKIREIPFSLSSRSSLIDYWLLGPAERLDHFDRFRSQRQATARSAATVVTQPEVSSEYNAWHARRALREIDARYFQEHVSSLWKRHPFFEFIVVLSPGQEPLLADTLDSLMAQYFDGWRLSVFAGYPSPDPEFVSETSKVCWVDVSQGALIDAVNRKILHSTATWFGLFACGVSFSPQALLVCGDYISIHPEWRLIYTDDDTVEEDGSLTTPKFKPDFNPDLLRSTDYVGGFFIERKALIGAGGYVKNPGGERYDVLLRAFDSQEKGAIGHIADVLCHVPGSIISYASEEAAIQSLKNHFDRRRTPVEVLPGLVEGLTRRVRYQPAAWPKVSIIIPYRNQLDSLGECIESLLSRTRYPDWELLIVDNASDDPDIQAYFRALEDGMPGRVRVLEFPGEYNYAAMNNLAAREACGEYLLLLSSETLAMHEDWLQSMMRHGQREEIGVVGARLVSGDGKTIRHAGMVLGMHGTAGAVFADEFSVDQPAYMLRTHTDQNYSAVSGACLLVRKSLYAAAGGMNEQDFPIGFGDVDLCLKIGRLGYRVLWTPYATLAFNGAPDLVAADAVVHERRLPLLQHAAHQLANLWRPLLANDPFWNRNLSLAQACPTTESQLLPSWNPDFRDRPRILWMPLGSPGQAEYRTFSPMRALHERGFAQCTAVCQPRPGSPDRAPTPVELARLAPDSLILHAPVDDVRCISLLHYKAVNSDVLKIYSLDDLITDIPSASYVHRNLPSEMIRERLRLGLAACDRLVVSTEPLADAYRDLIEDIRVLPNMLEWGRWGELKSTPRNGKKLRVGWAGAQQHAGDLRFVLDVVKATCKEVDWVFMGMMPYGAESSVAEFHDFVHDFSDYPAKLASLDLDLAIAPLEVNPFNEAKSNLRLLEYGILGWPVICTDIFPYRAEEAPVLCLPNSSEKWIAAIRERVGQKDALVRDGASLRDWVVQHYVLENNLQRWLDALTR